MALTAMTTSNWAMDNKQEVRIESLFSHCAVVLTLFAQLIDIIETVYRGASKGRGLVVSPKGMHMVLLHSVILIPRCSDYSTRYRY